MALCMLSEFLARIEASHIFFYEMQGDKQKKKKTKKKGQETLLACELTIRQIIY